MKKLNQQFPIASIVGVNEEPDSSSPFAGIVQDIKEHGVLNPVLIHEPTSTLITGQARVHACIKLGIPTIPAWLVDCVPGSSEAKLIAIWNDFERKWFTELEEDIRLFQWKQIFLQLHPETKQGVAGANAKHGHATEIISFAEHVAIKTHLTPHSAPAATVSGSTVCTPTASTAEMRMPL